MSAATARHTWLAETGEYIRPIILFQAQSKLASDPDRLTIEKVYGALLEAGVPVKDGRILVVEYKGKTFAQLASEKDKEIVGKTWADASGGKCLFVMPVARDFAAIDRAIDQAVV